tara:strand:- start:6381 stop:7673 length:1293 start_codon:yes stop_codon:yes gene_type:complete
MKQSQSLFERAQSFIPGGVNSPVRAFRGVGGSPLFIEKAHGPYIYDADKNRYLDYVGSWGPMILGHNHPEIKQAVIDAAQNGLSFGAPTALETQMAQKVCELLPSIERVRMVSSGTEATMSAIRLARGYTQRDKIIKFEGCYHGHADSLLVKAGSGALTFGKPSSAGIPEDFARHTLTATFNDLSSVEQIFKTYPDEIAGLIIEPIAGNMNCIPPTEGFLQGVRALCDRYQSVLIFDEVMTGFRVARGGAQNLYGIKPDLTCLGKIIGGGLPVGAFGGKKEIMAHLAPEGGVYQAGTLSGNPVAMSAGLKQLELLSAPGVYETLTERTKQLALGLKEIAQAQHIPLAVHHVGAMFGFFFTTEPEITQYSQVSQCNMKHFQAFYHGMLKQGIYFAPSAYEASFLSLAHTQEHIQHTLDTARSVFQTLAKQT